ncbi:MAG: hypothetical protein HYY89_03410 [candidate division NC10 bacterium]|nr:hypothetical protein [candidate division NC10 bacterium]
MHPEEMPVGILVLDPTADEEAETHPLAPRRGSLNGLRVGVLDNSKERADEILKRLQELLTERYEFAETIWRRKAFYTRRAPDELLREIGRSCDVVVTAVGG